ncbi:MAG: hypothetical protein V4725_11965 [Bacteroidota bacterium]
MKFLKIFRYEFAYQVRRLSTWLYLAVLLIFTIGMNFLITPGDGVYANNTFHIIGITVIGGVIWLLMGAVIAGEAAAREVQTRMHPLTYTSSVNKFEYLGGRFLAAFAVNALLVLSLPLGILVSFYLPDSAEAAMLPFRLTPYLNVYFLIALPNAFIATALQFTFATFSRQVMTAYLASLLLAIFPQVIGLTAAKLFGNWDLVKLLDPVGVAGIMGSELATWTPTEKNTRLVTLEGMFLWNRILWVCVAAGLLWLTYARFSFTVPSTTTWWTRSKRRKLPAEPVAETGVVRTTVVTVPQVPRSFGFATGFQQALTIGWATFRKIARNPVGLTLVGAIALCSAIFGYKIMTQFEIPLFPTTPQVIDYLTTNVGDIGSPWVVIPLLIMYFVGEILWSERDAGLGDIADATPVPEWALVIGKFLGLGLIIVAWMLLLMAGGIGMQLGLGYTKLEPGLYLKALVGIQLLDYLLFALLALMVHIVVNQKFIGYLVMFLVFLFLAFPSTFQVEHRLLIFGSDPGWSYTDMRGFGNTLGPWLWFKLYWVAWALLLAVIARLFWGRGRAQGLKDRLQLAKRRFTPATTWVAVIGLGLILVLGGFIFYNTNVLNEYQSGNDFQEQQAAYERLYGKYRNTLQPHLIRTKLNVEIYPDKEEVGIHAAYTLVNKDTVAIDSIHLGGIAGIEPTEVKFNRAATVLLSDKKLNHQVYLLKQPLRPGDSLELNFVVHYKNRGFRHNGSDALVVKNGTYFTNYDLMPSIGYQPFREIKDAVVRKKFGLAARLEIASLYDAQARSKPGSTDQASLEAIIGTPANEVAVAPGVLQRSWTTGDRRYFHYKTDASIGGEYSILSANYAVQESKWQDVDIRIYHHPGHTKNIDRMLRSVKASLEYYTEKFGPYPYSHFTLAEQAGSGGGASADGSMIYYGEQYAQLNPDDGPEGFEMPYYILAHEVAHQWWGLARLTPANVQGAGVLIEGLAVYSGMQVLEKTYGEKHLQQYVNFLHSFYEMPRSLATPSLLQADEPFLYYRKGGLALYTLGKYIGKEKVNGALRSLLQQRDSGVIPLPTMLDLYKEIKKVTPDTLGYLLSDLFETNTYWRLKTKQFTSTKIKADQWQVTLKVHAQKVVVDSTGAEHEIPMNDWLEVGIYKGENELSQQPLHLQKHRLRSGDQVIQVTVPRKPTRAGIDPNFLMIDLRRDDNMIQLDEE